MTTKRRCAVTFILLAGAMVPWPASGQARTSTSLFPACVKKDSCGYIDQLGKMVIEPKFRYAAAFSDGLAAIKVRTNNGDRWGFIDMRGTVVIPPQFEAAQEFSNGFAQVRLMNRRHGLVDKSGKLLPLSANTEAVSSFSEGLAAIWQDGKAGFVNIRGEIAISPQFDAAHAFSEGLAAVQVGNRWGYIDAAGAWIIKPQFAWAERFSDGLAAVKLTESPMVADRGYIDRSGRFVIPAKFIKAESFSEGLAAAAYGVGYEGYIDKTGTVVIPMDYGSAGPFSEGLAVVQVEAKPEYSIKYAYIDRTGKRISKKTYTNPSEFKNGLAYVESYNFMAMIGMPFGRMVTVAYVDRSEKAVWKKRIFL